MKFFYLISLSALLLSCQPKTVEKNGGLIINLDIISNPTNESQIDSALDIFRKRVESLYDKNPQVILSTDKKRIQIKLPLVADSIFVKDFIIRKGDFKTVETYNLKEIFKYLEDINNKLVQNKIYFQLTAVNSTDSGRSELRKNIAEVERDNVKENKYPLFSILMPNPSGDGSLGEGPIMGISKIKDTILVDSILRDKNFIGFFPEDLDFKWARNSNKDYLWLIAIKKPMNQNIITSEMISDARTTKNEFTDQDEVSFSLKPEYNHVWGDLTRNNINRSLAILIDDDVFSYPKVVSEITNGHSTLGGQTTTEQAKALSAILKYGPIPVDFIVKKITKF